MLTRLKVTGFKNLVDVDIRFGPFTCVAGANGVGKSNLFDAIRFLSALTEKSFMEAALLVRDEGGKGSDVRSLFHHVESEYAEEMSFEAEMIVPRKGVDDLGQEVEKASTTFLRYSLTLAYQSGDSARSLGSIELRKEELTYISLREATIHLRFDHKPAWRNSVLTGRRTSPFISTEGHLIKIHQDGNQGRPRILLAENLPRTVLSTTNTAETPTALLARREMQSWRRLHLEPSSLRKPDEFTAPSKLSADGSHLAATLYRLANPINQNGKVKQKQETNEQIYARVANRLAELIEDVNQVYVDRDEKRELLTLYVSGFDGTSHPARSLSDGTLRFLALAVLELDPEAQGLLCFEEPENGIHPERVQPMLRLLQDIATDVTEAVGAENPLRQVIINTHSPSVVAQILDDSLLVAEAKEYINQGRRFKGVRFSCLPGTWRSKLPETDIVIKGKLLSYLNPFDIHREEEELATDVEMNVSKPSKKNAPQSRRVMDRFDLQPVLPFLNQDERDSLHTAD